MVGVSGGRGCQFVVRLVHRRKTPPTGDEIEFAQGDTSLAQFGQKIGALEKKASDAHPFEQGGMGHPQDGARIVPLGMGEPPWTM